MRLLGLNISIRQAGDDHIIGPASSYRGQREGRQSTKGRKKKKPTTVAEPGEWEGETDYISLFPHSI